MGKAAGDDCFFYAYIVPFLISTVGGSIIFGVVLIALERTAPSKMQVSAETGEPMTRSEALAAIIPRRKRCCTASPTQVTPTICASLALAVSASPIMAQAPGDGRHRRAGQCRDAEHQRPGRSQIHCCPAGGTAANRCGIPVVLGQSV